MGIPGSANPMLFGGAAAYQINQSLRFNSADSTELTKTFGSSGSSRLMTFSAWVKRSNLTSTNTTTGTKTIFGAKDSSYDRDQIRFEHDASGRGDQLSISLRSYFISTSAVFRDCSAWYHVVIVIDTAQATAADRVKFYVNNSQITSFSTATYPPQNYDVAGFNKSTSSFNIGSDGYPGPTQFFDGYLAEVNFIDGTALTPSSFGETDTITGAWIPKKYSGSYGTNGFYLKFQSSGIGTDSSGNGNNFTASGFSTSGTGTDVMSDTPTNNWCTFNPLVPGASNFSDGNLVVTANSSGSANRGTPFPTFQLPTSGKWYAEFTPSSIGEIQIGLVQGSATIGDTVAGYYRTGTVSVEGTGTVETVASFTNGDVIGVIVNADEQKIRFSKNGTIVTTQEWSYASAPSSTNCYLSFKQGSSSGSCTATVNFGQRAFAYTPPTGFKALSTGNLPEPTIKKGSKYFDTKLYTGNGSTQSISGLEFSPDLVWIKSRTNPATGYYHHLVDAVRGSNGGFLRTLYSNGTEAEDTYPGSTYGGITSLDANGFSLANVGASAFLNNNTTAYAAWAWDANGAGSSNTAGSITSTVSANASAGFSIVTYTGTGSNATVGHGLGVAPSFYVVKNRNTSDQSWYCYHKDLGASYYIYLNLTAAAGTGTAIWNGAPSSSVFTLGTSNAANGSTMTYVAYCFSEVAGYSKFGSYVGNGSSDGPFVFLGFRPAWVMIKDSTGSGNSWYISDNQRNTYNVVNGRLMANLSNDESTSVSICDFTANGFKIRTSDSGWNTSSSTYVFACFAELPFKYSTAR